MNRLLILLILLAAPPCWAKDEPQPLRLEDFAYGMKLKVNGGSPVVSLRLPAEVYQGCVRPDLGDLRVFNAHGPVPHLLRPPQPEQAARPAQSLPFFPLAEPTNGDSGIADLGISIGSSGAIIAFRAGQAAPASQNIAAYLLDASALKSRPDWLEFTWSGGQFSASVRVDASDDLNSWQTLVSSAALAELSFGGHQLLRKRIELGGQAAGKYLRLTWPQGREGISLSAVQAGYESETRAQARSLLPLNGTPDSAAPGRTAWLYSTGGYFPADQFNIRLPEQNALAEFIISSRPDDQAAWQRRTSLLVWQLTVDGVKLESGRLTLPPVTDRFWRLETEAGSAAPVLELGWLPGQLVFMAQGEPPYTLAYGRAGLEPARSQVGQLLKAAEPVSGGKLVAAAEAGPQRVLAGQAALELKKEIPWRVWLLWAGLIAGVLAVGAMAWKLFREMERK